MKSDSCWCGQIVKEADVRGIAWIESEDDIAVRKRYGTFFFTKEIWFGTQ